MTVICLSLPNVVSAVFVEALSDLQLRIQGQADSLQCCSERYVLNQVDTFLWTTFNKQLIGLGVTPDLKEHCVGRRQRREWRGARQAESGPTGTIRRSTAQGHGRCINNSAVNVQ